MGHFALHICIYLLWYLNFQRHPTLRFFFSYLKKVAISFWVVLGTGALSLSPSFSHSRACSLTHLLPLSLTHNYFLFWSSAACSNTNLTGITGTFSSPGYPQPYPSHTECVWNITAPQGMLIALHFQHFNVYGWGSTCDGHFVTVYDVQNGQQTELATWEIFQ